LLTFTVDGDPRPQGSKTPITRNGKTWLIEAVKGVKEWRAAVTAGAIQAAGPDWVTIGRDVPVVLTVTFRVPRGKTVTREWPTTKPDTSKLARAVEDSLTDAGVWADDAQVVCLVASKVYGDPGVTVEVKPL